MRLVTTLLGATPAAMAQQAHAAESAWVEARLDAVRGLRPEQVARLRASLGKPAIATCRAARDGGRFQGNEAQREALLRAAVKGGFEAVDLEVHARFLRPLAAEALRAGVEVIVSRHDLAPAADAEDLEGFLDAVPPGALAKYAAEVHGPGDLAALLRAAALARQRGRRFAVMGLGDASLRLLAPALGCELVYCAPAEGETAAPGQLPAAVVQSAHDLLPPPLQVGAAHRPVALLGDPVEHSLSPAMQNAAFAAQGDPLVYLAVRAPRAGLPDAVAALRGAGFAGANVTAPHKEAVLEHLDAATPEARAARSVNTITVQGRRLKGHSTDGAGALAALREAGADPSGGTALVLGAGGTGRAVALALAKAGAHVLVANRTAAKAKALARQAGGEAVTWQRGALLRAVAEARILAHCASVGRTGSAQLVPTAHLHEKLTVLDAVYRPGGTPLVRAARKQGCAVAPGEALLLHQGALAYTLWTGKTAPLGAMRAALGRAAGGNA